jgi:phage shock protein PspC (stress-responsive transcriptional regulator)
MNKTLSVNIGGIVFHIEEQAYDRLNRYLEAIKGYFTTSDGRDEIIQDIEGRIGEMFQERITNSKQVIVDADVEQVIDIMGRPEQFASAGNEVFGETVAEVVSPGRRAYRKLYRDPDDRVISGVCAGIAHYINIEPIWIRLLFAISFFFFGSGLLLYLVLVIVMPKAVTTSEKLEMKGEQVNILNIRKTVYTDPSGRGESGITRFFDAIGELIVGFFKLLGKLIAVIFIIVGIMLLVALVALLLGLLGVGGISVPIIITKMFMEPWQQTTAIIAAFLVFGIPLLLLVFKALRLLFNIKYESRRMNWIALGLWVIGLVLSFIVITSVGTEFKEEEKQRVDIPIVQPQGDTLYLDVMNPHSLRNENFYINNRRINDPWSSASQEDTVRIENVRMDILKAEGNQFELVQISSSRGKDRKLALENARSMDYTISQEDSLIKFDETFRLPVGTKYRDQRIQLILKVPVGKSIYMSNDFDNIIHDIKNVTNTYDGDMVGRTWTMTNRGLECLGCEFIDAHERYGKHDNVRIKIDGKGVKVEGLKDGSDSSFHFDGDNVKINIDDEGVQIDARNDDDK